MKITFKVKMFSDKQKLREFIAMRLAQKQSYMEE